MLQKRRSLIPTTRESLKLNTGGDGVYTDIDQDLVKVLAMPSSRWRPFCLLIADWPGFCKQARLPVDVPRIWSILTAPMQLGWSRSKRGQLHLEFTERILALDCDYEECGGGVYRNSGYHRASGLLKQLIKCGTLWYNSTPGCTHSTVWRAAYPVAWQARQIRAPVREETAHRHFCFITAMAP